MEHIHPIVDDDPHFSINTETREITYTSDEKLVLIQGDHNSERFTFELPRMIDNHDMKECNLVQVHFINIDGQNPETQSADVYEVEDLHVKEDDEDTVVCSWLVSQSATKYSGTLNFALSFKCRDDNDKVTYVWNTAPYSGVLISNGINSADTIVIQYGDTLDKWYADFITASDSALANIDIAKRSAEEEIDAFAKNAAKTYSAEYGEKLKSAITVDALGVKNILVQEKGNNPDKVMSQASVTQEINRVESDYKNEMVETVNEVRGVADSLRNDVAKSVSKFTDTLVRCQLSSGNYGSAALTVGMKLEPNKNYRVYGPKSAKWTFRFAYKNLSGTFVEMGTDEIEFNNANPYCEYCPLRIELRRESSALVYVDIYMDGSKYIWQITNQYGVDSVYISYLLSDSEVYLVNNDGDYIIEPNGIADVTKTASGKHGADVYLVTDDVINLKDIGVCTTRIVDKLPETMSISDPSNDIYHCYIIKSNGYIHISLDGTNARELGEYMSGAAGWSHTWYEGDLNDLSSAGSGYFAVRTFEPLVDTYTISFDNGQTRTFDVTNGNGISSVERTDRGDYEDTYIMYFTDGTSTTFKVPNGGSVGIKKTVTGETISIDDISPIEHEVKVNVKSKNLISIPYYNIETSFLDGVNYIRDTDGTTITVHGTTTKGTNWYIAHGMAIKAGTYTLSLNGSLTGMLLLMYSPSKKVMMTQLNSSTPSQTFTIDEDLTDVNIYLNCATAGVEVGGSVKPQLEEGSVATEWVPYVDISTVALYEIGKMDGVDMPVRTYTPNLDGTVSGVTSTYPTMEFATDKSGVIIEAKYNRDVQAMLEEVGEVKNYVAQAEAFANETKAASNSAAANVAAKAEEMIAELGIVQEAGDSSTAVMSQAAASNAFANAIKKTVSGEVVRVEDVSPIPHKVKVKVTCPEGVDPTSVTVRAAGKNLIPFPYVWNDNAPWTEKTVGGVTATVQDDGGVRINGTATGNGWFRLSNDPIYHRVISPATKYDEPPRHFVSNSSLGNNDVSHDNSSCSWYIYGLANGSLTFCAKQGFTFDNVVIYPQIEYGRTSTEFEKGVAYPTITLDENGCAEFLAIAPIMTVWAVQEGVTVEVEYNVDSNAEIESIKPSARLEEYGLPILYLMGDTYQMTKDTEISLLYKYGERQGTCSMKWQGSSSIRWPKKNYTVKFDTAFEAKEGWGEQKKYCLKANYVAASHARNIVGARIWADFVKTRTTANERLLALPNCGAVDGFPIIIVLNGEFHGLYTFNIPKDKWMMGMGEGTSEAIICADATVGGGATCFQSEANFTSDFEIEYAPDENNTAWIKTSVNRLINAVRNSDGSDIDTTIAQYLDIDSAIDYILFTVFIQGYDNLHRNYLLSTYDGTKWFFTQYDMDSTFGLTNNAPFSYRTLNVVSGVSLSQVKVISKLAELLYKHKKDEIKARYHQLRQAEYPLGDESPTMKAIQFISEIPQGVYAKDFDKWRGVKYTATNNYTQISEFMRKRLRYMDENIDKI